MRAKSWRMVVLGISIISLALYGNLAYAQKGDEGGGHGGGGGGGEHKGDGGAHNGDGRGNGVMQGESRNYGGIQSRGEGVNQNRGRSDGNWGRGNFSRDGGGGGGQWDRGYTSYYGRGWGYRPGFGWDIDIPLGRFGGIGIGNYGGYFGSPYYGRGGWGTYGWGGWNDGNYGYWGPGYDTYSYDYSSDNQSGMEPEIAPQYAQSTEGEQGQGGGKLPPLPTNKELASFTNQQLNSFIAWVARGYSRELGQFSTGDTWVKYFKLDNLRALAPQPPAGTIAAQPPETPTARSRSLDKEVLERMDSVLQKNEYQTVTNAWGFKALRAALKEVSRPADERTVTVLKGQAEMLNKSLERVSTGDGWRETFGDRFLGASHQ